MDMSVKFDFYLSEADADRLFAIKEDEGKNELTANDYARELLSSVLFQKHPESVKYDENGNRLN
jgi:hypothetical protein